MDIIDHEDCGSPLKTMVDPNLRLTAMCEEHELEAVGQGYRYITDLSGPNLVAIIPQLVFGIEQMYDLTDRMKAAIVEQRDSLLQVIELQREHLDACDAAPLGAPLLIPFDSTWSVRLSDGSNLYYLRTQEES